MSAKGFQALYRLIRFDTRGASTRMFDMLSSKSLIFLDLRSLAAQLLAYPMCRRVADGDETLFENMNMAVMKAQENVA